MEKFSLEYYVKQFEALEDIIDESEDKAGRFELLTLTVAEAKDHGIDLLEEHPGLGNDYEVLAALYGQESKVRQ